MQPVHIRYTLLYSKSDLFAAMPDVKILPLEIKPGDDREDRIRDLIVQIIPDWERDTIQVQVRTCTDHIISIYIHY